MAAPKEWELILAEVAVGFLLAFSIFYFRKAKGLDENMKTLRHLNIGLGIMFLFLFISRILDNPLKQLVDPAHNLATASPEVFAWASIIDYDNKLFGGVITNGYFVNMFFLLGLAIATFFMERAFIPKARHVFFILLIVCAVIAFIPITGQMIDIFDPPEFTQAEWTSPLAWQDWFTYIPTIFTAMGYVSFAVIPIIYFILAGKTTGQLRGNALLLAFGFIFILVDVHTMGHWPQGGMVRVIPCMIGFVFLILGNRQK
jgi:hypothetical protein